MNSRSSLVEVYEKEFSTFLTERIKRNGGCIQLQHITGHLSQLRNEVKNAIVNTKSDLIRFLKEHDHLFLIKDNVVSLVESSAPSTSGYESDTSSMRLQSNLPLKVKNGKGVVVKIFPHYGFIKSKEPVKTDIYFKSSCFSDKNIDLTSVLYVGAIVFFHARRESSNLSCKYHALKVWRIDNDDGGSVIIQKSRKNRETGLYDPLNLESEGVIQNVFPNLGFISVKGDDNNTVFFHKNRVVNYDNIIDLTKVFSKGDRVEFTAHRSSKPDAKARWEATKVWKISGKIRENESQFDCNPLSLLNHPISVVKTKNPEMIKNQCGKIYPRSNGAVIKFSNNELADGDSAEYYVCGTKVTEIGWEFTEGDDVYFDAVKIKSTPGWKAVLVWSGTKPDIVLKTCLGDYSEFTDDDDNGEICSSIYTSKSSLPTSESSNSSLKLEKMSSKRGKAQKLCGSKEMNKLSKHSSRDSLNSLTLSDKYCSTSKEVKDANKYLSVGSSRESLNSNDYPSSQKITKSLSNKSLNQSNKMLSSRNDNPYPVDEAYESMEACKNYKSDTLLKYNNEIKHFTEDDLENSSEYASAEEEKVDKNSEMESDKILSRTINLKSVAASIERYYEVKGEINKVYSRLAEIKSSTLKNTVSFSSNDFYLNEMTIHELGVDDLKDLLKVGDSISFNCFLIIDDSGQSWQKVSLAWQGSKPRCPDEISPEDFIQQNDLSVTVKNELSDENKDIHRKFLTSFIDDNDDDNLSRTESCSEESLKVDSKVEPSAYSESLSDIVHRILKKDIYSKDSMVDIKSISEDIINIVVENYIKKTNTLSYNVLPEARDVSVTMESICSKCKGKSSNLSDSPVKTKSTTVQTIITGKLKPIF